LWVLVWTAAGPGAESLLRLDPTTLQMTRQWHVGTGGEPAWGAQVLIVAGGQLWAAAGNRLARLALHSGLMTAAIALPGAVSSDVSADAAGTTLIVAAADDGGSGTVQRRDAVTGALLASYQVQGVAAPVVAGPTGGSVWISEATGMMGYVQRLDAISMTAAGSACTEGQPTSTCVPGTNAITARIAGGVLWITQTAGGQARNYCADPVTGQRLAPIQLPQQARDIVLAIGLDQIFYAAPGPGAGQYLRREAVPSACRHGLASGR
jgi:hypothetical protein